MEADQLWDLPGLHFQHERAKGFKWASVLAVIEGLGEVRLVLVQELDKKRPQRLTARYSARATFRERLRPAHSADLVALRMIWGAGVTGRTGGNQRLGTTDPLDSSGTGPVSAGATAAMGYGGSAIPGIIVYIGAIYTMIPGIAIHYQ